MPVEIGISAVDVGDDCCLVVVWCSSVLVSCVVDAMISFVAGCEVVSFGTAVA